MSILVKIQQNVGAGPTIILVSPSTHAEAGHGYGLLFQGVPFTGDSVTGSTFSVTMSHLLERGARVRVANNGGKLPDGLEPDTDYYVRSLSADRSTIELSATRNLKEAITFTSVGSGTHYFLTWPEAEPFRRLGNALYKPSTVEDAGKLLAGALTAHPAVKVALDGALLLGAGDSQAIYFDVGPEEADSLPWETLYQSGAGATSFMALDPRWPIARVTSRPSLEREFAPPLKLMAVLSAPGPQETADGEWQALHGELAGSGIEYELMVFVSEPPLMKTIKALDNTKVTVFELADEDQILNAVKDYQPDLLHFFCHGSPQKPPYLLMYSAFEFENQLEPTIKIHGDKLANSVAPTAPPWLLTLNCCEGAAPASSETINLASSLSRLVFPSVIGMRRKVASEYANEFTKFLYRQVLDEVKGPNAEIEWARVLWKARQEIATKFAGCLKLTYDKVAPYCNEWTVPVLYTGRDPLTLKRLPKLDARRKATRQALVRIRSVFSARGDEDSRKVAEEIGRRIISLDAESQ